MTDVCTLTFQPGDVEVPGVPRGETVLRAAMQASIHINASCGGTGTCGKCRVRLLQGQAEAEPHPKLSAEEWAEGVRLACRTVVLSDAEIFIPETSRMGSAASLDRADHRERQGKLLTPVELETLVTGWKLDPVVKKYCLQLDPPTDGDNLNDLARLKKALKDAVRPGQGLRRLHLDPEHAQRPARAGLERDRHRGGHLLRVQGHRPACRASDCEYDYSVVLDIGTTTRVGSAARPAQRPDPGSGLRLQPPDQLRRGRDQPHRALPAPGRPRTAAAGGGRHHQRHHRRAGREGRRRPGDRSATWWPPATRP